MKRSLFMLGLLWLSVNALAQREPVMLRVGDGLPDVLLSPISNYPVQSVSFSSLHKYVILDFWGTSCYACLESFPETQAQQEKWKDQLQVFLVNGGEWDTPKKVTAFMKEREKRTGFKLTLPYILQDSVLRKWFPYQFIPHLVWLNPQGKVIAVTDKTAFTEENLQTFLDGRPLHVHEQRDDLTYNHRFPLWSQVTADSLILYYSILTKGDPDLARFGGQWPFDDGTGIKWFSLNTPLQGLIRKAYFGMLSTLPDDSVHWQLDSAERLKEYCYEAVVPGNYEAATRQLQVDIDRFLGIEILPLKENGVVKSITIRHKSH